MNFVRDAIRPTTAWLSGHSDSIMVLSQSQEEPRLMNRHSAFSSVTCDYLIVEYGAGVVHSWDPISLVCVCVLSGHRQRIH